MLRRACSSGDETASRGPASIGRRALPSGSRETRSGRTSCQLSVPLTARIESRISSAVRRRMSKRQNRSLAGSAARASAPLRDDMRYAFDVTISRCSGLSRQPLATNSDASQSSSSGMRRGGALEAEIVRRADDAAAEWTSARRPSCRSAA